MKIAKTSTLAIAAVLMSTAAHAGLMEDAVANLTAQGYTSIEVKNGLINLKIEATKDGVQREMVINKLTGEVTKDETGDASSGTGDDGSGDDGSGDDGSGDDGSGDDGSGDDGSGDDAGSGADSDGSGEGADGSGGDSGGSGDGGSGGGDGGGSGGGSGGGGDTAFNYVTGGHSADIQFG